MTLKKIKDNEHLLKDTINNSIMNTDMSEYKSYVERYRQSKKLQDNSTRLNDFEKDLNSISMELKEIKELLMNLTK